MIDLKPFIIEYECYVERLQCNVIISRKDHEGNKHPDGKWVVRWANWVLQDDGFWRYFAPKLFDSAEQAAVFVVESAHAP